MASTDTVSDQTHRQLGGWSLLNLHEQVDWDLEVVGDLEINTLLIYNTLKAVGSMLLLRRWRVGRWNCYMCNTSSGGQGHHCPSGLCIGLFWGPKVCAYLCFPP